MKCFSCLSSSNHALRSNPNDATVRLWCPTWVSAHKGPIDICDGCYYVFDPSRNEYAANGCWFLGEAADEAFRSVEQFIPRGDARYENAKGMIENGRRLLGNQIGMLDRIVSVVDGKVWIGHTMLIARLGDYSEVMERYPTLCMR